MELNIDDTQRGQHRRKYLVGVHAAGFDLFVSGCAPGDNTFCQSVGVAALGNLDLVIHQLRQGNTLVRQDRLDGVDKGIKTAIALTGCAVNLAL